MRRLGDGQAGRAMHPAGSRTFDAEPDDGSGHCAERTRVPAGERVRAPAGTPSAWAEKDSNLRRQNRQIYSLLPLATREPHQFKHNKTGAGDGT